MRLHLIVKLLLMKNHLLMLKLLLLLLDSLEILISLHIRHMTCLIVNILRLHMLLVLLMRTIAVMVRALLHLMRNIRSLLIYW